MKLQFINPDNLDKNLKATAHRTGKLGFSIDAARKLELSVDKTAGIAINDDDRNDQNLYVAIYDGKRDTAFKISKAGDYYYINAKSLFERLEIDYTKDSIVYDISETIINDQKIFKFRRREKQKDINKE